MRGFYKKTLLRAQTNFLDAKKRRQKYCREKERKTGLKPYILQESDILNMAHVDLSSSTPRVAPGTSSTQADHDTNKSVLGLTANPNLDCSGKETPNIGVGGLFNSPPSCYTQADVHATREMIQFSTESPSEAFAKSQSEGFPFGPGFGHSDRSIFSIPFSGSEIALTTSASELPVPEDVSGSDLSVANIEPGRALALGNTGLQSSAVPELVPIEGTLSDLALPPKTHSIICDLTTPVALGDVPVYVPLSEQGSMLKTVNMLSEEEYQDLEDLFMDHD